jgi:sensor histidine kinase YesM
LETFFAFIKKYYSNIWIRNSLLLSIIIFFNLLSNSVQTGQDRDNPLAVIVSLFLNMVLVIIHNHVLLRLFLFQRKIIQYLILFIAFLAVTTLATTYFFPWILDDPYETNIPNMIFSVMINTVLASILYFLHFYFLKYIKMNEIEILNQQTEIENLKQQLNPHFLLNSLNNLYSVSLTKPEAVSDKILELSDLLKYQIETCKKDYITLFEEQKFIEKYIAYSQWKLQNITINTSEKGTKKNYKVTPMIFLPLLENAVKYANFEKNPVIEINWEYSDSKFSFSITNDYLASKKEHFSTKIGLKNLKKRIELFHPDSKLEIIDVSSNFKVTVSLWNLDILV